MRARFLQIMLAFPAFAAMAAGALIAAMTVAARAEFRICNDSFDVLNIALAEPWAGDWRSRGWWRIAPNQCAVPIRETLGARQYFVYATDVFGRSAIGGAVAFCVAPRRFAIEGAGDCLLRGYAEAYFAEVDTGGEADWTLHVAPRP